MIVRLLRINKLLISLSVRNILLIEKLDLEFDCQMNAFTGETGAGKSLILDSLSFVLGSSGGLDLLRGGEEIGEVIAIFSIEKNKEAAALLDMSSIPFSENLIIKRVIKGKQNRTQALVNDRACSIDFLRKLAAVLVEFQSQTDSWAILDSKSHRSFLDNFGELDKFVGNTEKAWLEMKKNEDLLLETLQGERDVHNEFEFLSSAIQELEALGIMAGEETRLITRRKVLKLFSKNKENICRAAELIRTQEIDEKIIAAIKSLQLIETDDDRQFSEVVSSLDKSLVEVMDARSLLHDILNNIAFDPNESEILEERLFELRSVSRKYNVTTEQLPELLTEYEKRLLKLNSSPALIQELKEKVTKLQSDYKKKATLLSQKRQLTARDLDKKISNELRQLKMERAIFKTELQPADVGRYGNDQVQFKVITNPGETPGAINKIASGGELSRFLLAMKVCLSMRANSVTIIFDEIDRGIGGATADAVGKRLLQLSESTQVLAVTHSPQVAGYSTSQWLVQKSIDRKDKTVTTITKLSRENRVEEIARMLSGKFITKEAKEAAKSLIKS